MLVTQIREAIEIAHTSEYGNFLRCLFPVFTKALREGVPQFREGDEQKIRLVLLEILNRLPNTEVLRQYVPKLLELVMDILMVDNQENALICLRIIFDVHKNFSPDLKDYVQRFINFFINLYLKLEKTVKQVFGEPNPVRMATDAKNNPVKVLRESQKSFKVLTECPLIVMLLFQLYSSFVDENIQKLIPLMMKAIMIAPPKNLKQEHGQLYKDFIAAQVKTLSFLTYVLRGFAAQMQPHQDDLSQSVIHLLLNCPTSSINSRKELLVATRHILATNFRKGFFKRIEHMLDEKVLIGPGRAHEIVRPLAYSTLADLVHHVRADLTIPQLSRVIYIFSRNIHDPTLPLTIQTASVRLILNLVDHIYRTSEKGNRGRLLLVRILSALVNKFDTLRVYIPKLIGLVSKKEKRLKEQGHAWTLAYTPRTEQDFPEDSVREVKQLMFTMVFGLKTVVWCISNFREYTIHSAQRARSIIMDEDECRIVARFLKHGLECFKIYTLQAYSRSRTQQIEKDVLEHFASVFTVLGTRSFKDVFSVQIGTLFDQIVANRGLPMLIIPQHFLSSSNVSKAFADILLSFLIERMKDMAEPIDKSAKSRVMLNLFRIVFGSVTLFSENEAVLRPYLKRIVSTAMKHIKEVKFSRNYLSLLRFLFRSIGGGKFELLYKEFLPLLPELLRGLMEMQARGPDMIREISIELCLTVPARLSSLLPYIPLLVKAVVLALKGRDEQVIKLGLRTLEFWVDNLNPEYLYPHMCTVLSELMRALCALLRPRPSPFGVTALTVLGKLGGRNRRFLIEAFAVDNEVSPENGLQLNMSFNPKYKMQVPMDKLIAYAGRLLCRRRPADMKETEEGKYARKQAFKFLRTCALVMVDRDNFITRSDFLDEIEKASRDEAEGPSTPEAGDANADAKAKEENKGKGDTKSAPDISDVVPETPSESLDEAAAVRSRTFNSVKEHIFRKLCRLLIIASSDKSLCEDKETSAKDLLAALTQHFALIFVLRQGSQPETRASELDPAVFLDAIVEVMSEEDRSRFDAAKAALDSLLDMLIQITGKKKAAKLSVMGDLLSRLSHCCYQDRWEPRHAGCVGLATLCERMAKDWVRENQGELIRAFMFTYRDSKSEYAEATAKFADASLDKVVEISCESIARKAGAEAAKPMQVEPAPAASGATPAAAPATALPAAAPPAAAAAKPAASGSAMEVVNGSPTPKTTSNLGGFSSVKSSPDMKNAKGPTDEKSVITKGLVQILAPELISGIFAVRECAHRLLGLVSRLTGKAVAEILSPYRTRLLAPVLQQSLHAVPMSIRIGYISAATYCLSLRPPLVTVGDLVYLLLDAIQDAGDDDTQQQGNVAGRSGRVHLRNLLQVEDIKLMSAALTSEHVQQKKQTEFQELKNKLISVFFQSLISRSPEIVKVAKEGLKQVIDREKLQKELLQQCMRPILFNLADIHKLSVQLLDGLARLLELLSNCFNVTLGEKLLDHLGKLANPDELRKLRKSRVDTPSSQGKREHEDHVQIAAKIIGLFYLLPPASDQFLEPLVAKTLELESILPSLSFYGGFGTGSSSPYRAPLIKFLSVEPAKTCEYFLKNLHLPKLSQMFQAVLRDPGCEKIRQVVKQNPDDLIKYTFEAKTPVPATATELIVQGTIITHIISTQDPKWLSGCEKIVGHLLRVWTSKTRRTRLENEQALKISHIHESKLIVECLIHYCRVHRSKVKVLWKMLDIFLFRTLVDFTFLAEFYEQEVAQTWTPEEKNNIIKGFLDFFSEETPAADATADPKRDEQLKVKALKLIIIPILEEKYKQSKSANGAKKNGAGTESKAAKPAQDANKAAPAKADSKAATVDAKQKPEAKSTAMDVVAADETTPSPSQGQLLNEDKIINTLIEKLLSGEQVEEYCEDLRVQLLRLSTLLIQHVHPKLARFRKTLIKFAWNHLKSENTSSKQWAYVNVCRFIDVYETPPKIVLQVYVALLRTYQPEARKLVSKALDIITPALPKRLEIGKHKHPTWIKWTKKIIVEEGHQVPQLIHIWNLIIRHPDLFYPSRTQFVPQMVNSLNRLGLPSNRPPENRKLALDLADLIIRWDKRCHEETAAGSAATATKSGAAGAGGDEKSAPSADAERPTKRRRVGSAESATGTGDGNESLDGAARQGEKPFRPNAMMKDIIITFLIRLGLITCEVVDTRFLSIRCLKLLEQAMKVWKGGTLRFDYIKKILASPQNANDHSVLLTCTLEILNTLLTHQSKQFIVQHILDIELVLEKCFPLPNLSIRKGLCGVVSKIIKSHPGFAPRDGGLLASSLAVMTTAGGPEPTIAKFYGHLRDKIEQGLRQIDKVSIHTIIALVSEISKVCPNYMDSSLSTNPSAANNVRTSFGNLVKATHKLAKDHLSATIQSVGVRARDHASRQREQQKQMQTLDTLIKALSLVRDRAHAVAEHKKMYIHTLLMLAEKSNDTKLLLHIAETVRDWMTEKTKNIPQLTHKERVEFILRMARFEKFPRPANGSKLVLPTDDQKLSKVYLGMVLELFEKYNGAGQKRPEWLSKLQKPFMLGLCCRDVKTKHRFVKIYHQHISDTLHLRLNAILATQDWGPLREKFWICQAVDMLLSIIVGGDRLRMSYEQCRIPAVSTKSGGSGDSATQAMSIDGGDAKAAAAAGPWDEREGLHSGIRKLLGEYSLFLSRYSELGVDDVVGPMRELIYYDRRFAAELWVLLLPKAWSRLTSADRDSLSEPIVELLSEDWHLAQRSKSPNPVQVLLDGFSRCKPMPPIRPVLLQYLARVYKSWHLVVRILEARVLEGNPQQSLDKFDNLAHDWDDVYDPDQNKAANEALQALYEQLRETNVGYGLLNMRVRSTASKSALAHEQYGRWHHAQDTYYLSLRKIMSRRGFGGYAQNKSRKPIKSLKIKGHKQVKTVSQSRKRSKSSTSRRKGSQGGKSSVPESIHDVGDGEVAMWQSRWLKCAKNLNQWKILSHFAHSVRHPNLQLECAWRESDWNRMRRIFGATRLSGSAAGSAAARNLIRNFSSETMLYYNYLVLNGKKPNDHELDMLLSNSVQKALVEWKSLPDFVSDTHTRLLHQFHVLVELKESIGIIHELNNYRQRGQSPNLKTFITTWRERLPNKWEGVHLWSQVAKWRNQMFALIHKAFPSSSHSSRYSTQMHDTPWTVIKFAQTARKQHLTSVCLEALQQIHGVPNMSVPDRYNQRRERIKCCLQQPNEIRAALNMTNKTSIFEFTDEQKAEIFRLKGEALQHLGYGDESNTAFSSAISICDSYGKAWLSWAIFCDRVFNIKQDLQWAKHAVVCYLQAIFHKKNRARLMITRIMWLLHYDRENGPVNKAFLRYTEHIPAWVWLLWIPQLLSSLARPEGQAVKNILRKIAKQYPQALYYTVRAYLIEKRELRRNAGDSSKSREVASTTPQRPVLTTPEAKLYWQNAQQTPSHKLINLVKQLNEKIKEMEKKNVPNTNRVYLEFCQLAKYINQAYLRAKQQQKQRLAKVAAKAGVKPAAATAAAASAAAAKAATIKSEAVARRAAAKTGAAAAQRGAATAAKKIDAQSPAAAAAAAAAVAHAEAKKLRAQAEGKQLEAQAAANQVLKLRAAQNAQAQKIVALQQAQKQQQLQGGDVAVKAQQAAMARLQQQVTMTMTTQVRAQTAAKELQQQAAAKQALANQQQLRAQQLAALQQTQKQQKPQTTAQLARLQQQQQQAAAAAVAGTKPTKPSSAPAASTAAQAKAAAAAAAAAAASVGTTSQSRTADAKAATPQPQKSPVGRSPNAIKWVEEVVSVLRKNQRTLMTEVEKMLDEFARRFKPEPEEELLGAVHALILKCFKQPLTELDRVPRNLQTTIGRVCRKFFTPDPKSGNKKHLTFVKKYKDSFERDFSPERDGFPSTLGVLLGKLKRWKAHLQFKVGERSQIHLRLEKLSPYLIRFQSYDIEIPGQYLGDQEPALEQNVVLNRFHPDVEVHHTHGFSHRRIGMRGSDGKLYSFFVQYSISHITRSDERMMQLYILFNRMMAKHQHTRNMNLTYHVPLVVPLTHRLRLMQTDDANVSLEEVYEQSCAVRGVDPDEPLLCYRDTLRRVRGGEQNLQARLEVFNDICARVVPDYILSRFVSRTVRSPDQLWAFKKEFAAQVALSGYLSHIMNIGDRSLHKLSFSKKSARIINSEFYPAYNSFCIIDCQETVPFRLTRNISSFLTPLMVNGIVSGSIMAINSLLLRKQDVIKNYFCLFVRDDLLSWNSTKISVPDDHGQRALESKLRDKIKINVRHTYTRVQSLLVQSESGPMNSKVNQLIKNATSQERLCMMNPTWQPWF